MHAGTLHPSSRAIGRYAPVALFQAIIAVVVIYAEPLLALAAMGTASWGPVASARATGWLYLCALPLMLVARLPFDAAHQLLNRWPAGAESGLLRMALSIGPSWRCDAKRGVAVAGVAPRNGRHGRVEG